MATITTEATIEIVHGQCIARLPAAASDALPSRGQVAVTGTLDGEPFATVVEPDGERGHWIKLVDAREAGEVIALDVEPTKEWPEVEVPDDLQAALDDAPDLDELWTSITPMARWEWVRWVRATRSETTRAKRVDVSISKLRDGKRRPCCFDLSACTDPELSRGGKLMAE